MNWQYDKRRIWRIYIRKINYQAKFLLYHAAILIFIMVGVVGYFYYLISNEYEENDKKDFQVISEKTTEQLDSLFYEMDLVALQIVTNPPIIDVFQKIRIERAKTLLEMEGDILAKDVAEIVGYPNPLYFSKIFKKKVGVYPSEYRKQSQKKNEYIGGKMEFNLAKLNDKKKNGTVFFLEQQGHSYGESEIFIEHRQISDHIISVDYDGRKVIISADQEVGFYRGLHLFMQELSTHGSTPFLINETARFTERGLMLDCSRNGTLSIDFIKETIGVCAAAGINQVYLYMEDVYDIPEDPHFGAFRGKYTIQELKDLDSYGENMGVELIPAIQTLAHLHTYLKWPITKKLQDTEDILLVGTKETEKFIRRLIHYVSLPFSTKKIHVGMDEADLLGLGKYLRINGYRKRYEIMKEHLDTVYRICRDEDLQVLMWSDMFFRLKSPTGDYYDLLEDTEFDEIDALPEDLSLVYWDYYHHKKGVYDKNIKLHYKLSNNLYFATGGWTWNGLAPNYRKAKKTMLEGLNSCSDNGIDKVMCTFWFDNGMETPAKTLFYSALYFAQLCYGEKCESDKLDKWLNQLTGCTEEDFMIFDLFDSPDGILKDNENADNPSKYLLYQDPLVGVFDGQVKEMALDTYYSELYSKLNDVENTKSIMNDIFAYYKELASVLIDKSMLGVKLRNAYSKRDKIEMERLKNTMEECAKKMWILKEARKSIWFKECKPFGYEVLDIRFGGVYVRLMSSVQRIDAFLKGRIDKLEELEEETVIYNEDLEQPDHKHCMGGFWQHMVSAANISGI